MNSYEDITHTNEAQYFLEVVQWKHQNGISRNYR